MASPSPVFLLGEILWINFPQRLPPGHEQFGRRPVVVVAVPEAIQAIPYRVLLVVPLTRTRFSGPLFPLLQAGTGGLPADSSALIYQLGAFGVRRVCGGLGMLSGRACGAGRFGAIRRGLCCRGRGRRSLREWTIEPEQGCC